MIGDGVAFAVVAGTDVASPAARDAAMRVVADLRPAGGTAMGSWLRLAGQMFSFCPAALRHAILLTDGRNEHESPQELTEALRVCEGAFSCDCRGVGTDWEVAELRRISTALLGSVDIVADPSGLAADFESMMQTAMGKQVADVALRVWTPQRADLKFVKQVAPTVDDLTARRAQSGPQAGDYPTGAWGGGESRDYHVCVQMTPAGVGQEMLAARVSLVAGSEVLGQGMVSAVWTDDEALTTRIRHLRHADRRRADRYQRGVGRWRRGACCWQRGAGRAERGAVPAVRHRPERPVLRGVRLRLRGRPPGTDGPARRACPARTACPA